MNVIFIGWLAGKEAEYVETLSDGELCDTLTKVFQGFLSKVVTKMPAVTKVLRSSFCDLCCFMLYLKIHISLIFNFV